MILILIICLIFAFGGGGVWYNEGAYRGPGLSLAGLLLVVLIVLLLMGGIPSGGWRWPR